MSSDKVSIYLKQGDSYFFLASALARTIKYDGGDHPALVFEWMSSRLYGESVRSAHMTYPDTGQLHATINFTDGEHLHVRANQMTMRWQRGGKDFEFPSVDLIKDFDSRFHKKEPPAFANFTEHTFLTLVTSAILTPVTEIGLEEAEPKQEPHRRIIDLGDKQGTLNLFAIGAGKPDPHIETELEPSFAADFIIGKGVPYFGWSIRLYPDDAITRLEESKRLAAESKPAAGPPTSA